MEGSSSHEEERTATFYVHHPCYFLEEALKALLKCFGIEYGTKNCSHTKEEKTSLLKPPSEAHPIIHCPSNNQKSSQDAANPTSSQSTNASLLAGFGSRTRGSDLTPGPGPQHN